MLETRNSPVMHEIVTPEPTIQWRKVNTEEINVYVPWDVPVEALGQMFVFGEAQSRIEVIALGFEGEGTGEGDGDGGRDAPKAALYGISNGLSDMYFVTHTIHLTDYPCQYFPACAKNSIVDHIANPYQT